MFELEPWLAPKELALGATALLLLPLVAPRWRRVRLSVVDALVVAFVLWSGVSAALAANRWLALAAFGVSFSGLVVYAAGRTIARSKHARVALAGLALAATLGAALGVAQAYGFDAAWLAASRPPGGTFGNRNFLAHAAAIATPLLLLLALRARPAVAVLALAGIGTTTAAIVLTRSRAAWLGLGAAVGIMVLALILARGRPLAGGPRGRALLVGLVIGAAAIAAVLVPNDLRWRADAPYAETLTRLAEYRSGSGRGRLIQYRNTAGMVAENPLLGVGPGNWFVHYPRFTRGADPSYAAGQPLPTNPWPSSDWVALTAERGLLGALLLAFAGLAAILAALRRIMAPVSDDGSRGEGEAPLRRPEMEGERALGTGGVVVGAADAADAANPADAADEPARAVALLGVLAAAFVTGLFDAVLLLATPTLLVFAALGLLLPASRRPVLEAPLGRAARGALLAAAFVIACAVTAYAGLRTAAVLVAGPDERASLALAARLDPGGHRIRLRLARAGGCDARLPHARAAAALMPHHDAPAEALRACGE